MSESCDFVFSIGQMSHTSFMIIERSKYVNAQVRVQKTFRTSRNTEPVKTNAFQAERKTGSSCLQASALSKAQRNAYNVGQPIARLNKGFIVNALNTDRRGSRCGLVQGNMFWPARYRRRERYINVGWLRTKRKMRNKGNTG